VPHRPSIAAGLACPQIVFSYVGHREITAARLPRAYFEPPLTKRVATAIRRSRFERSLESSPLRRTRTVGARQWILLGSAQLPTCVMSRRSFQFSRPVFFCRTFSWAQASG